MNITRFLAFYSIIAIANIAMGVDEYTLPDINNYVDTRHLERATCQLLYYDDSIIYKSIPPAFSGERGGTYPIFPKAALHLNGTGVVYAETKDYYYVLTAGHVLNKPLWAQFNYAGERSRPVQLEVLYKRYVVDTVIDIGICRISKSGLGEYPEPTILPLADSIAVDDVYVIRFGVQKKVRMVKMEPDMFQLGVIFHPGNSGSPIFHKSGKSIVGLCLTQGGHCIASTAIIDHIKKARAIKL